MLPGFLVPRCVEVSWSMISALSGLKESPVAIIEQTGRVREA
jgi:hypothetical protein